ncbi:ABC transporter ATP-binding protein [Thioalkalivibrio thiocyanodenitrificans]|uniref:ABC transporter ATP-binding protein n=1 Tax=Thioalkalivibrio thiocyanodenitrificans TaxID=243063 RepID=UPI00037FDDE7|nr:sn-glycerol-3-phosphate ABC transporter ATP-binding protein UgpC [Thioalkalivibrio thiocyanodenitrificans]
MSSVEFRGVRKAFDGNAVIPGLDLSIRDGEFLVLLGPSGCGKSTLMRMLAGLEEASAGEILMDGRVVNALSPQARNVAMVFQNYALYPHMRVRDNLAFPLRMRGLKRAEIDRRVREAAATLGLGDLLERRPGELSGGQRQRVAMGRAIVREPAVFLMDEPLSNLDARLRVQVRTEIAALQQRLGTTTLYVTHDQVEAMTLGQRVAVMDAGRLQQVAEPLTLYRRPANRFVAGFLGNPSMNIFPLRMQTAGGRVQMQLAGQWLDLPAGAPAGASHAGLRPEHFALASAERSAALKLRVEALESLGHETLVYFLDAGAAGTVLCAARVAGQVRCQRGENLDVSVDVQAIHWFDAAGVSL